MKKAAAITALLALGGAVGAWYWMKGASSAPKFRLGKVERGDILVTVSATGTVQPVVQVQVGTQVSGTILKLLADFNSRVKANDIVAQIDPATFQARVDQDRANVARAEADIERVKAGLEQARKDLERAKELAKNHYISQAELDTAVATNDSQVAQLKVAEATVEQNRSALRVSETSLLYTTIRSPIDGVVVSRNVDVGQTVAASLSAPTIFVIAESLKRVQIQASVVEADIGRVSVGQAVTFHVDAYREREFAGKVSQLRLSPTTVQNVVTYVVIIDAENPDEKLMPGMTANVTFEVERRTEVLKAPNAALRFIPPAELIAEEPSPSPSPTRAPHERGERGERGERPGRSRQVSTLWLDGSGRLRPVRVITGQTDGSWTEIVKGEITEGQEIVVGVAVDEPEKGVTNPFAPTRMPGGRPGR